MNKSDKARKHLLAGLPITPLQSLELYRLQRLASLVHKMRVKGIDVQTIMVEEPDGTRYAKYFLPINKRKK